MKKSTCLNRIFKNEEFRQAIQEANSSAHGDGSLYVGSAKLSFNRAAYELEHRTLNTAHIPKYLSDNAFVVGDLPTGVLINDLSVLEWVRIARTFIDDEFLGPDDVFPASNKTVDFSGKNKKFSFLKYFRAEQII